MASVSATTIALRMPRGRYVITLADVPEGRAERLLTHEDRPSYLNLRRTEGVVNFIQRHLQTISQAEEAVLCLMEPTSQGNPVGIVTIRDLRFSAR
jgi:hypothetical protein